MHTALATAEDVARCNDSLSRADTAYVDTEFHAENRYTPRLYVVQIATAEGEWAIDADDHAGLKVIRDALLALPWVVHGGQHDIRLLSRALGAVSERIWDTQIAAGLVDTRFPAGFGWLVEKWLGEHIDKGATLSDWSKRPLSPEQLSYALGDVVWLRKLWERLKVEVESVGRTELMAAACDDARARALEAPNPDDQWRRIGGAWALEPSQAVVAQALAAWRELTGREMNQPPRRILSDGIVLDLARKQPCTLESMRADRRMPKGLVRRHGETLLEIIDLARRRPAQFHPQPVPRYALSGAVTRLLDAAVRADGIARRYAGDLVLPPLLAEDLALDPDAPMGWRATLLRDIIPGLLNGYRSVVVVNGCPVVRSDDPS